MTEHEMRRLGEAIRHGLRVHRKCFSELDIVVVGWLLETSIYADPPRDRSLVYRFSDFGKLTQMGKPKLSEVFHRLKGMNVIDWQERKARVPKGRDYARYYVVHHPSQWLLPEFSKRGKRLMGNWDETQAVLSAFLKLPLEQLEALVEPPTLADMVRMIAAHHAGTSEAVFPLQFLPTHGYQAGVPGLNAGALPSDSPEALNDASASGRGSSVAWEAQARPGDGRTSASQPTVPGRPADGPSQSAGPSSSGVPEERTQDLRSRKENKEPEFSNRERTPESSVLEKGTQHPSSRKENAPAEFSNQERTPIESATSGVLESESQEMLRIIKARHGIAERVPEKRTRFLRPGVPEKGTPDPRSRIGNAPADSTRARDIGSSKEDLCTPMSTEPLDIVKEGGTGETLTGAAVLESGTAEVLPSKPTAYWSWELEDRLLAEIRESYTLLKGEAWAIGEMRNAKPWFEKLIRFFPRTMEVLSRELRDRVLTGWVFTHGPGQWLTGAAKNKVGIGRFQWARTAPYPKIERPAE